MSKMFDLLSGKSSGPVAEAEARAEYSEGWLGVILEENERLRTALTLAQDWVRSPKRRAECIRDFPLDDVDAALLHLTTGHRAND